MNDHREVSLLEGGARIHPTPDVASKQVHLDGLSRCTAYNLYT